MVIPSSGDITSIGDAIRLGQRRSRSWFRGNPDQYPQPLTPRVHRNVRRWAAAFADVEQNLFHKFRSEAPAIDSNVPRPDDYLAWLSLMQHHRLPTRLLDWTENILVALYFAALNPSDGQNGNGDLWVMYPYALNEKAYGIGWIPGEEEPILQALAAEPARVPPERVAQKLNLAKPIPELDTPLAFEPIRYWARTRVQQSVFTIHPRPEKGKTIEEVLKNAEDPERPEIQYVGHYMVPADYKDTLLKELEQAGLTRDRLFPSLDELADKLGEEDQFARSYTPLSLPRFS